MKLFQNIAWEMGETFPLVKKVALCAVNLNYTEKH